MRCTAVTSHHGTYAVDSRLVGGWVATLLRHFPLHAYICPLQGVPDRPTGGAGWLARQVDRKEIARHDADGAVAPSRWRNFAGQSGSGSTARRRAAPVLRDDAGTGADLEHELARDEPRRLHDLFG